MESTAPQTHIMLVEDDASLAEWISDYLTSHNYLVTHANQGDIAVELIESDQPDLVILDINLPIMDGFDVCKAVRNFYHQPILMLTARDEETDEVLGLELGADDYLAKPVKPRILLARIKALLRREPDNNKQKSVHEYGSLRIDSPSHSVTLGGETLHFSSHEFDLLWLLAENAGNIMKREAMVSKMRGIEYDGFDRSIDITVSRLRKKLERDPSSPTRIKTIRGQGYLFTTDDW